MSGGSYDYAYHHVEDVADEIEARAKEAERVEHDAEDSWKRTHQVYSSKENRWLTPEESKPILDGVKRERLWFAGLLKLVAQAMHDIEWVDSGDFGPGDEVESIQEVKKYVNHMAGKV